MRFLFVEGEMLHKTVHTLAGTATDLRSCHFTVEDAVLGKILEVTAAKSTAVDINARRIPAGVGQIVALAV